MILKLFNGKLSNNSTRKDDKLKISGLITLIVGTAIQIELHVTTVSSENGKK